MTYILIDRLPDRLLLVYRSSMLLLIGFALSACVHTDDHQPEATGASVSQTPVYTYPTRGQSAEQQDRDRYECYRWARKKTGFDPSDPQLAPHQRYAVVAGPPPGQDVAAGAITGAVLGSVVARPGHQTEGAAVGAVAGATLGAAAESTRRQEYARATKNRMDAQLEQQSSNYRRALTACLAGRGYTVR